MKKEKQKMDNKETLNKEVKNSVFDSTIPNEEIKLPPVTRPMSTVPKKQLNIVEGTKAPEIKTATDIIYYFYLGDTEVEYYTFIAPEIVDGIIYIKNVIKKGVVSEQVLETELFSAYLDSNENKLQNIKFPIIDSEGVILKCHSTKNMDLQWVNKTKEDAVNDLKEQKLKLYDKVMPNILNKLQNLEERANVRRNNASDNLMDL